MPAAVVPHGSSHLHAAEAMRWAGSGGGSLRVASLDAGLLCYGEPTAFPTPFAPADLSYGASWNLWNNIWGTNYPQWYPFEGVYGYGKHGDRTLGTDASFRFELEF